MSMWVHPYTLHNYTGKVGPVLVILVSSARTRKQYHGDIVEAVDHRQLLSTFILDLSKVFEHLHMLWMVVIWVHIYTVTLAKLVQFW